MQAADGKMRGVVWEEPPLADWTRDTGGPLHVRGLVTVFTVLAVPVGVWAVANLTTTRGWDPWAFAAVLIGVASRAAVPFITVQGRSDQERSGHGVVIAPALVILPVGPFVVAAILGVGIGWTARRLPVLTRAQSARRNSEIALVLSRTALAAAAAAAVALLPRWPEDTAVAAAVLGAVAFALVDALSGTIQAAVVERRPLVRVARAGLPSALPIETIAIACGVFVALVVSGRAWAPAWILLAATVALALAATVSETEHARARYQSLVRLAAATDAVRSAEEMERVVVDAVAELVHASRGELREHPPQGDEIGVALSLPGNPTWLVMADRQGLARQFTVQDRELLRAAGPLASAAIGDAVERAGMSTMLGSDPLTGLANRRGLAERAPMMLAEDVRFGRHTVVAVIDIDDFKPINDDLGHDAGDQVLRTIGERLSRAARHRDVVGRLGGDEFVVVAGDLPSPGQANELVDRLRHRVAGITAPDGRSVEVSLGVAVAPKDGTDVDDLLRVADRRMYAEKRSRT